MTPDEIHDYEYQLQNAVERLNRDPRLRAPDRKLILSFLAHIKAQGVSTGRQAKYVNMLRTASLMLRIPWRRARRKDIEDLMVKLCDHEIVSARTKEVRHYSAETMADFHMVVKRFQKFVRYGDTDKETPYPDEVRWLRKNVKESDRRAPLFFTDQEVEAMVKAADTLRDKAFVAVYGEMGGRPAEFLLLRVGDITFDDNGAVVHIMRGKTGWRTVRLVSSAAYLADHISTHPYRNDPNAPLWLTTSTNHLNEPLSWIAASKVVKQAGAKAGLKKERCHMYMFRHGSATRNARFLTDAELRLMYGWSPNSKVPGRYIHLSGGDLDAKYLSVYGSGRPVEPPKPEFALIKTDFLGTELEDVKNLNGHNSVARANPSVEFDASLTPRELEDIEADLQKGLPPIAWLAIGKPPMQWKHAVVITKLDRETGVIHYNDPAYGGHKEESLKEFSKKWYDSDRWLARLILGRRATRRITEYMRGGDSR